MLPKAEEEAKRLHDSPAEGQNKTETAETLKKPDSKSEMNVPEPSDDEAVPSGGEIAANAATTSEAEVKKVSTTELSVVDDDNDDSDKQPKRKSSKGRQRGESREEHKEKHRKSRDGKPQPREGETREECKERHRKEREERRSRANSTELEGHKSKRKKSKQKKDVELGDMQQKSSELTQSSDSRLERLNSDVSATQKESPDRMTSISTPSDSAMSAAEASSPGSKKLPSNSKPTLSDSGKPAKSGRPSSRSSAKVKATDSRSSAKVKATDSRSSAKVKATESQMEAAAVASGAPQKQENVAEKELDKTVPKKGESGGSVQQNSPEAAKSGLKISEHDNCGTSAGCGEEVTEQASLAEDVDKSQANGDFLSPSPRPAQLSPNDTVKMRHSAPDIIEKQNASSESTDQVERRSSLSLPDIGALHCDFRTPSVTSELHPFLRKKLSADHGTKSRRSTSPLGSAATTKSVEMGPRSASLTMHGTPGSTHHHVAADRRSANAAFSSPMLNFDTGVKAGTTSRDHHGDGGVVTTGLDLGGQTHETNSNNDND